MKKTSHTSPSRAFTIIELLVVIAIIALLSGIIMSNLTGSKAKARDAKRVSDLGQIQLALELFYDRCKSYPGDINTPSDDGNGNCPSGIRWDDFMTTLPSNVLPNPENSILYDYGTLDDNSDGRNEMYILHVELESWNSALVDDIDVEPNGWPAGLEFNSFQWCEDSPSGPYRYCLIER